MGGEQITATTIALAFGVLGGFPGHTRVHPRVLERMARLQRDQVKRGTIDDAGIVHCGDRVGLILTGSEVPGSLIDEIIAAGRNEAAALHLCPAADDTRTIRISLTEREHEPVLVLLTESRTATTQLLYRVFADPLLTTRLVSDQDLGEGFVFDLTMQTGAEGRYATPEESYPLLGRLADGEVTAARVLRRDGTTVAAAGTGSTGGACLIRTEGLFPSVGEVLAPFLSPHLMAGMTLMPVSICDAHTTGSAGPSRITAFGFALNQGRLIGPADLFDDPAFDPSREAAIRTAATRRVRGPFRT